MNSNLLILGAGQYGQVAKETAEAMGCFNQISFLDDHNEYAIGKIFDYLHFIDCYRYAFVAIGDASLRLAYIEKLESAGYRIPVLINPRAYVSPSAQIMSGTIVEPMAVINTNATLGIGVFACAGCIVNHDAVIGDCCQLDCGSVVGASAKLPMQTKLGYGQIYSV